jgi:hypothetical protein
VDIQNLFEIFLTLAMYCFGGYVFVQFVWFILREVAPKLTSGRMTVREYISLGAGFVVILILLSFGPYYLGQALLYGWSQFKPVISSITTDVVGDFSSIVAGDGTIKLYAEPDVQHPENPALMPTAIMPVATQPALMATPTLAPTATATPFTYGEWTPEQPVPTPGG